MKYIKLTLQYMTNRHYWKLALMVLVPSIAVSLFTSFSTTADFIVHFFERDLSSFSSIYGGLSEISWQKALGLVAVLLLYSIICAIFIGAIQRHMRTGTFALINTFKRINEHFLPSFITIAAVFLLVFLFGFAMSLTVAFWWAITHNQIATFIMTLLFMIVFFLLMVFILSIFSLTCPNIICTGQGYLDSISYSIRTTRQYIKPLLLSFALPIVLFMLVQFPFVLVQSRVAHIIIDTITLFCIGSYYPVLIFVTYYDINDKERQDLLPANRL